MRSPKLSADGAREVAVAGVVTAGFGAAAFVLVAAIGLARNHVIGAPTAVLLCVVYLAMCMASFGRCFVAARSARYAQLAPLGVLSVASLLATFGILTRMALGETKTTASEQQLMVALVLIAGLAVVEVTSRLGRSKVLFLVLALPLPALVGAEIAARPTGYLTGPGSASSTNWAEPFLSIALLGWIAGVLGPARVGRLGISAPVRLALAPAVWVLIFALTRDLASVALLVGGVAAWRSSESKASRPVVPGSWSLLITTIIVCGGWILSWGVAFQDFLGARQLILGTGPSVFVRYRLAHLSDASGSAVQFLVPLKSGVVLGLILGLFAALAMVVGLLWWIARGIADYWAGAWAKGLTAFLAAQCVLAFVGLMPGPAEGFPTPFLSESAVWDGADALVVAIVIGLASARPPNRRRHQKSHMEINTGGERWQTSLAK
jgi:hypothetical protein